LEVLQDSGAEDVELLVSQCLPEADPLAHSERSHLVENKVIYSNGRESTVNRSLDGSIYPG
jgi:hypothetical protein